MTPPLDALWCLHALANVEAAYQLHQTAGPPWPTRWQVADMVSGRAPLYEPRLLGWWVGQAPPDSGERP